MNGPRQTRGTIFLGIPCCIPWKWTCSLSQRQTTEAAGKAGKIGAALTATSAAYKVTANNFAVNAVETRPQGHTPISRRLTFFVDVRAAVRKYIWNTWTVLSDGVDHLLVPAGIVVWQLLERRPPGGHSCRDCRLYTWPRFWGAGGINESPEQPFADYNISLILIGAPRPFLLEELTREGPGERNKTRLSLLLREARWLKSRVVTAPGRRRYYIIEKAHTAVPHSNVDMIRDLRPELGSLYGCSTFYGGRLGQRSV